MLYIWEDQDIHHNIETLAFVGESRSNYMIIGFKLGDLFAVAEESTGQIVVSPLTRQGMAEWLTMNGHIPAEIISHGPGNHKNPYVWADSIVLKNLPTHPNMRCVTTPFTGFDPARTYGEIAGALPDLPEPLQMVKGRNDLPPIPPKAPAAPPPPQVSRQSESLSLRSGAIPSSPATDEDKLGDMQRAPSEDMLGDPFA